MSTKSTSEQNVQKKTSEENEAKDELQSALNRIADKSNENN
ncbi:hypothetical protein ACVDHH_04540 [Staphylococcus saprophyticus]